MELYDTVVGLSLSKKEFISASEKGTAGGVATLNANGKIPETQLPSYVDDIVEGYLYEDHFYEDPEHTTEIPGEAGKIYVDIITNRSYRWSGSTFVEVGDNDEYTADRALVSDENGKITASDITTEELATLDDITGNIQTQLNGKIDSTEKGAANGLATLDANSKLLDSQLPTVTADRALVSDANGKTSASSVTSTELGYLSGATSNLQTQISGKQATITGAATTITSDDLTASRALISNASGKVGASSVTATELGYVSGVTSAIQTQLDGKQASVTGAASTITSSDLTASRALVSDSSGKVAASDITSTKLGYLTDVTSNIQSQINGKQATITGAASTITSSDLTASKALVSNSSGKVEASSVTDTQLGYLSDVTSNIQSQINGKQASVTGAASTITSSDLTASRALVSNSSGKVAVSSITSTKLGYLTDVTSNIQSQIDGKQASITGAASSIASSDLTASRALISDSSGKVAVSSITSTKLGYLSGVTSSVQTQLDAKGDTLDFNTNTRVLSLKRGSTVLSSVTIPTVKIVPFNSGTDAQIAAMIAAADRGDIDLYADAGWRVGDERQVTLSAMDATGTYDGVSWTVGESHAEQTVTLILLDGGTTSETGSTFTGSAASAYTLVNNVYNKDGTKRTNPAFIVGLKDVLAETGYMNSSNTNSGSWGGCARKNWCDGAFRKSFGTLIPIFKQFKVKTAETASGDTLQTSQGYFALAATKEIYGSDDNNSNSTERSTLIQFSYYSPRSTRRKSSAYFSRSPRYTTAFFVTQWQDSSNTDAYASYTRGISPIGCI